MVIREGREDTAGAAELVCCRSGLVQCVVIRSSLGLCAFFAHKLCVLDLTRVKCRCDSDCVHAMAALETQLKVYLALSITHKQNSLLCPSHCDLLKNSSASTVDFALNF